MTSPDVAAIEARLTAATDWPWHIWRDLDHQGFYTVGDEAGVLTPERPETEECNPTAHVYVETDAEFIAHAPADIAALLDEVKRVRAERDRYRDELTRGQVGGHFETTERLAELALKEAAYDQVRELSDQWARGASKWSPGSGLRQVVIAEMNGQLAEALDGEGTDPGCPFCGDLDDPDQPDLHARCRQIPDAEARRDGRDG